MAFRIHKGIFQNLNAAGTAYENAFKVDRDGVMKAVSTDGTVGSAFLKVGDKASDSNLLDGIDSGNFLRSDAEDIKSNNTMFTGPVWIDDTDRLGTSKYRWTNSALTTTSIEIVDDNGDNAGTCATLVMHNYGDGGVQFRMGNTGDKWLYLSSAKSNGAGTTTDDNSERYFVGMKINNNTVWHAGNLTNVSQLSNNAGYLTSLPSHNHDDRYYTETEVDNLIGTRAPSSHNHLFIKPYREYGSYIRNTDTPLTLKTEMGGGGLRVDFLNGASFNTWSHVITWSGYDGYNMYQLAGNYGGSGGAGPELYVRTEPNHSRNSWSNWQKLWHDGHFSSTDVTNWNTAYGWGNHASAGYALATGNATQAWVTAQGFASASGNATQAWVSSQGYLTSLPSHTHGWGEITGKPNLLELAYSAGPAWNGNTGGSGRNLVASYHGSSGNSYISLGSANGDLNLSVDGNIYVQEGNQKVATESFVTSRGYLTSLPSHNHDDRYYTETESNARFLGISAKASDSNLLDGLDSSRFLHTTTGAFSGDWNDLTNSDLEIQLREVQNITNGSHSNHPTGVYTYGSVLGWQLSSATFKLYASHTGDLAFQTGWNNDGYSGWRNIIHSANIQSQSVNYANSAGTVSWANVSGKPSTFTPSSHSHHYITNNYSAAESGSFHSWDAQESTPDKNPTTDWFTALRIGHGHPVNYYSNTLAIQMTGGDTGRIYTRTIHNGTKQSWKKYWHDGDFSVAAVNNGNTAYSWGNHASAGYLTSLPSHNHNDLYYTESESNARFLGISAKAADSNLLDGIDSSGFVRAYGTTNDNIDSDWGQSFKTFDPVPSGTPPIASPNLRTINVGDNFARRTQLAFTYATDQAWFRRRDSSGWHEWREFIHSGNIGSQSVNYASSAGAVAWGNVSGKPSTFSPSSHNHDDRYYTEAESDARYLQSLPSHNHDDRYYTETEVNTLLAGKLGSTAKAADSNLIDGIDSSRIVYGDGSNGRSVDKRNGNANVSDSSNASGFYFGYNVAGMPTTDWWNWLTVRGNAWSGTDGYQFQLAGSFWGDDYRIRRMQSGTNHAWVSLIHSGNIGSQSVNYATTAGTANAVAWGNVSGKPSTFSPSAHTHTPSQVGLSNLSSNGNALAGNFTATGDITAYSDSRVKENVTTIDNALDKVMSLRGVEYNKIGSEEKSLGVIAQEIREVLPEVVKEQEDGMLSVAYGNITAVLIEALKEQQKQIDELKAQIDAITK